MKDASVEHKEETSGALAEAEPFERDDLLIIDEVCDAFEAAWRTGAKEPEIDVFLAGIKPELHSTAREELLAVAHHWRHQRDHSRGTQQHAAPECEPGTSAITDAIYGRLKNQFQLDRRLGSGATGEVWKATNRRTGEVVAIKIPHLALLGSLTALIRFCREARWQTRLRHPHIGAPEEVVMAGEMPVLVSRFIDGVTLKEYLERESLTVEQAVELVVQLADGLEYAHAMGIVHRDLKPANVLLERLPDGRVDPSRPVIVDFGLAITVDQTTVTHDGQTLGTPAYMSPEQARGGSHAAGVTSDVYSLGVLLFEALTGRLPIDGRDVPTLLYNVIHESPRRLRNVQRDLPSDLEQICAVCLSKSPRDRYQSARDFAEDLRRWRRHETIRMQRPNALARMTQWGKRHPAILTSILSVFSAVAATSLLIVRESYLERLQLAYNKSTQAINAARSAHRKLESHLAAYQMGRIGAYWALNNPEQARLLLAESSPTHRTWEWRYFNRLVNRYHLELRHSSPNEEGKFSVRAIALSSDGKTLFSGSRGGTLYRWNLQSVAPVAELIDVQEEGMLAVALSPDDQIVGYGTNGGDVYLRKLSGDRPLVYTSRSVESAIHSISFSPDGKQVAIGGGAQLMEAFVPEKGFIVIVDIATGQEVYRDSKLDNCVVSLAWHPSGNQLLGAGGVASNHPDSLRSPGKVWLWDTTSWNARTISYPRAVKGVAWAPRDLNTFATCAWDGSRTLWDATSGVERQSLPPLAAGASACGFSTDGNILATASEDGTCSLWDIRKDQSIVVYHAHSEGICCLAFTKDQRLVTGGLDEFIRFWDAKPAADPSLDLQTLGKPVSSTQHGDYLLVAVNDVQRETGQVYALRIDKHLSAASPQLLVEFSSPILQIDAARDSDLELAVALDDGTVNFVQLETKLSDQPALNGVGKPTWCVLPFNVADSFARSRMRMKHVKGRTYFNVPEFATIASSSTNNQNKVWVLESGETNFQSATETNFGTGRTFAVSPDGAHLATVSDKNLVSLWKTSPLEIERSLLGHDRVISALAFSDDGKWLASGSWDRRILLWDIAESRKIHTLNGHTGNVLAIAFHPTEPRLFSAGTDRQIRVWDLTTGFETATLSGHKAPVVGLYLAPHNDTLFSIDDSGTVKCW